MEMLSDHEREIIGAVRAAVGDRATLEAKVSALEAENARLRAANDESKMASLEAENAILRAANDESKMASLEAENAMLRAANDETKFKCKTLQHMYRSLVNSAYKKPATKTPAAQPTETPAGQSTKSPAAQPTKAPARRSTKSPAAQPTKAPARRSTKSPAAQLTKTPAAQATKTPAAQATKTPAAQATKTPAAQATKTPAAQATKTPASQPTKTPAAQPTKTPAGEDNKENNGVPTKTPAPNGWLAREINSPLSDVRQRKGTPIDLNKPTEAQAKSRKRAFDETGYEYQNVVRDRDERRRMPTHTCSRCDKFIKAQTGYLTPEDIETLRRGCRHRSYFERPNTPPGFWDLSFADSHRPDDDDDDVCSSPRRPS